MKRTFLAIAVSFSYALSANSAVGQVLSTIPSVDDAEQVGSGLVLPPDRMSAESAAEVSSPPSMRLDRIDGADVSGALIDSGKVQPVPHGHVPMQSSPSSLPLPPLSGSAVSVPNCNCEPTHVHGPACSETMVCDSDAPISLFANTRLWTFGGWSQFGYHSKDGGLRFNQHADRVNLHQAWLFAEKAIDTTGGFDVGGRIDYLYGVDAQDTQAFGLNNDHWDNGWDNGIYGHALPQLYFEAGYGDLSAKVGKFFTIIGNEVVAAPDNFFYSHAYTMYNSEPFTHTGALLTYDMSDAVTLYGGYTLGWDSGYEDNGDSFLGGITVRPDSTTTLTYATVMGRFGEDAGLAGTSDELGYMHSLVLAKNMSDQLTYIFQTDYLDTEDAAGNRIRNSLGINQYLIYQLNEKLAVGSRFEWWNISEDSVGFYGDNANLGALAALTDSAGRTDVYGLTVGLNYRPHANVLIRPELRWDFVKEDRDVLNAADVIINENNDSSQTTFGIDTIFLF